MHKERQKSLNELELASCTFRPNLNHSKTPKVTTQSSKKSLLFKKAKNDYPKVQKTKI